MKSLLTCILLLLTLSSCLRKPLEPLEKRDEKLPQELFEYFGSVGEGSWFVFKRLQTGAEDTVRVIYRSDSGFLEDSLLRDGILISKQVIDTRYKDTDGDEVMSDIKIRIATHSPSKHRFEINYRIGMGFDAYRVDEEWDTAESAVLDSFSSGKHTFQDVLWLKAHPGLPIEEVFFVKNIGLVRYSGSDGNITYELQDWHIEPVKP